jgi:hypothetical protein
MCQFIGVADLAGNALIELLERNNTRTVTFKQLRDYGTEVKQYLDEQKIETVLLYNTDEIVDMSINYATFFTVENFGQDDAYIKLKENINKKELWMCFRSPFSVKTILAFTNDNVVKNSGLLSIA